LQAKRVEGTKTPAVQYDLDCTKESDLQPREGIATGPGVTRHTVLCWQCRSVYHRPFFFVVEMFVANFAAYVPIAGAGIPPQNEKGVDARALDAPRGLRRT
jgi:hypothetical protein